MPWSGTGISDTVLSPQGFVTVPDDAYDLACIHTWEEGLQKAEQIGFPIMIKASEGGGGKGIRKVEEADKFKVAFQAVAGEVPGEGTCASLTQLTMSIRLTDLCDEARRVGSPLGGPAHCRSIR